MKRILLFALLTSFFFSACSLKSLKGPTIAQSWKFTTMKNADSFFPYDSNSLLIDSIRKRLKMSYLRFYDDRSYTFIGDNISRQSSWTYNQPDSTLTLDSFFHALPVIFKLERPVDDYLHIHLCRVDGTQVNAAEFSLIFQADPHFERYTTDLMSHESNAWRIRPNHKESPAEIRKRVLAHMDYVIDYFQLVEDEGRSYFEPIYFQTCLRFYQNGIGLENEDYLSKHWIHCFYDRDDALQGYKLIETGISKMGPYPDAKTFTEGYLKATKQLRAALKKMG